MMRDDLTHKTTASIPSILVFLDVVTEQLVEFRRIFTAASK